MRIVLVIAVMFATGAAAQPLGDRYGGQAPAPPASAAQARTGYDGPLLNWSRKTPAPLAAAAPQGPRRLPGGLYAATAAPPAGPALPRSLYDSAEPRFYSVYREYGGAPDALPRRDFNTTWAHRPEASLIEPLDPPKKDEDEGSSPDDWGAGLDDEGLLGGAG